jgi:hypothetical protein
MNIKRLTHELNALNALNDKLNQIVPTIVENINLNFTGKTIKLKSGGLSKKFKETVVLPAYSKDFHFFFESQYNHALYMGASASVLDENGSWYNAATTVRLANLEMEGVVQNGEEYTPRRTDWTVNEVVENVGKIQKLKEDLRLEQNKLPEIQATEWERSHR